MVEQSIQNGWGERAVIVEDDGPFFIDSIGGQDSGTGLVTSADNLEKQVSADFVDW